MEVLREGRKDIHFLRKINTLSNAVCVVQFLLWTSMNFPVEIGRQKMIEPTGVMQSSVQPAGM